MAGKYTVYILRTDKNTLYTGQTSNLEKRIERHRSGRGAKYLRRFNSLELVYVEKFTSLSLALKREWEIKRMVRVKKLELVKPAFEIRAVVRLSNQYLGKIDIRRRSKGRKK